MSTKRLQVLLDEDEFDRVRADAARSGMNVSEWVRYALRRLRREEAEGAVDAKLEAIDRALGLDRPTGDIDQMLAEIERGRDPGARAPTPQEPGTAS